MRFRSLRGDSVDILKLVAFSAILLFRGWKTLLADRLAEIFRDPSAVEKLKKKLPVLFKMAELEVQRGGKVGMEAGVLRERVLISFLIYKFGENQVITDVPAAAADVDVYVKGHDHPISIKTSRAYSGVKLRWTVDWDKVEEFYRNYEPGTDILFTLVSWGSIGFFSYIPLEVQMKVFSELGRDNYVKLPKKGTNPRGIELSPSALKRCVELTAYKIPINWTVPSQVAYNPYVRWVELWRED